LTRIAFVSTTTALMTTAVARLLVLLGAFFTWRTAIVYFGSGFTGALAGVVALFWSTPPVLTTAITIASVAMAVTTTITARF
jgi:hypothetical protein